MGTLEYLPADGGTRPWFYTNGGGMLGGSLSSPSSKRARKMSAFMPMRGRRAEMLWSQADSAPALTAGQGWAWLARNTENSDEGQAMGASVFRGPARQEARAFQQPEGESPSGLNPSRGVLMGGQPLGLLARGPSFGRLQAERARQALDGAIVKQQELETETGVDADPVEFTFGSGAGSGPSGTVQLVAPSRARRGFHPMRGKRSPSSSSVGDNVAALVPVQEAEVEQQHDSGGDSFGPAFELS